MSRLLRAVLILFSCLTPGGVAWAGVYITTERDPYPLPTALDKVKYRLSDLLSIDDRPRLPGQDEPDEKSPRGRIRKLATDLEAKRARDELTPLERVDLGGCYIRLGQHAKAMEILDEGVRQVADNAPERFLLLANLAAAYQGIPGLLPRAVETQKNAIAAAPSKPPAGTGWEQDQWDRYRIAERYFLTLLEKRAAEATRPMTNWSAVDPLFPKVRFVGPGGEYEAGKLAADSQHELPRDALAIVVQLLYWMPADSRLFWLYGELLNVDGDIASAYEVLHELRGTRGLGLVKEIGQHRKVLLEWKDRQPKPKSVPEEEPVAPPKPTRGLADWRALGAGFGAGLLVALFGGVQLYIWAKRRGSRSLPAVAPVTHPGQSGLTSTSNP